MTGSRGRAPCVLLGVQGGYSLTRENIPLIPCSATGAAIPTALCAESKKEGRAFAQPSSYAGLAAAAVIAAAAVPAAAEEYDDKDNEPEAAVIVASTEHS